LHEMGCPEFWCAENLLWSLVVCFVASFLLGLCSYLLISINAGHKDWKERLGVAFKVFYRSFICCLCPVFACCCYYYISRKRRCILCTKDVKKIDWSHNSKCKREFEEEYNEIPDSPAFLCGKCNSPFKIWPKEKLALLHSLWCVKCDQVIIESSQQNIHVCFLCDKMLCGRHIRPGTRNTGRSTVDWAFLENLHTNDDYQEDLHTNNNYQEDLHTNGNYQEDLFIQPTVSSSVAQGPEPSVQNNPDDLPGYNFKPSGPPTTPRDFTPSAPLPSVQHSSRLGFNPIPSEISMEQQSRLLPRMVGEPEASSHPLNDSCQDDLPPSYHVAMQDQDSTY